MSSSILRRCLRSLACGTFIVGAITAGADTPAQAVPADPDSGGNVAANTAPAPGTAIEQTRVEHAATDKSIVAARVFLAQGAPDLACMLTRRVHGETTVNTDAVYILALCSRDQGDLDASIDYYQRLLGLLPDAPRPKAELAALYSRTGQHARAEALYRQAAELERDTATAALFGNLARAAASDDPTRIAVAPKRWQLEFSANTVYDTNLNAGPAAGTTAAVIGGVPVQLTLNPAMHPRSSWGSNVSAGGRYLMPLSDRWAVLYQGSLSAANYFDHDGFDTDSAALGAAFLYRNGPISASIQPNARYVRQQSDLQEATHGLTTRISRQLNPDLQINGSLGYFDRRVPLAELRNADGYRASTGFSNTFGQRIQIGADYMFQREKAELESESRDMHGLSGYAMLAATPSLRLVVNYRTVAIEYQDAQPLFRDERKDKQHQLGAGAILNLRPWLSHDIDLSLQYSYTRNDSNLALYDYDRQLTSVGFQARF